MLARRPAHEVRTASFAPCCFASCLGVAALVGGCSPGARDAAPVPSSSSPVTAPALRPMHLPDLSGADAAAQAQIRDRYLALQQTAAGAATRDLGVAYGEMGKLFMAAELNDAAAPCLLNAVALVPDDPRWSYYLAHLYRRQGDLASAAANFERTLARQPENVAVLWWLGMVYLDQGKAVEAEQQFSRALVLQPAALSAVYGLGMAALSRGDYARAADHLERVLTMNSKALGAHYPLTLAYRGLGQQERAAVHMAQRSRVAIVPQDPLIDELDTLLQSTTAYQDRGMRAAQSGNWAEAAKHFQMAVASAPDDPVARLDLSTALRQTGDLPGALEQAREAVRLAPQDGRARAALDRLVSEARGGAQP